MRNNNKKRGVSLVSLVIIIVVMTILSGVIISTSLSSFESGNVNMFASELVNIQTEVDNYYLRKSFYPVGENFEYTVPSGTTDFNSENIVDGKITFRKINFSQIGIKNLQFGNEKDSNDLYVISTTSGKVYYLQGINYKSKTYYTITDELLKMLGVNFKSQLGYKEIVEYDVIFSVSNINPTNSPVVVTVKLPKEATVNSVTATNSKEVSSETIGDNYKIYIINETGENRNGNYEVTVNYTYNLVTKQAKYSVENFNNVIPNITYTSQINDGLRTVTLNITEDNIDTLKYETSYITDSSYFDNYGKVINNNTFVVPSNSLFTIYAVDKAKNTALVTNHVDVTIGDFIEYNVAYTDVYKSTNVYINKWLEVS